jgi:hypothetical protein
MPVFGFNTDTKVGGVVFHVQTEDRGAKNPVIDTTIYVKGRILAKRVNSYKDFLVSPDFNEAELRAMLEKQHKEILEEVKAGKLAEMSEVLQGEPAAPKGISLKLLNPTSFLKGAAARMELAANSKDGSKPLAGVNIRLTINTGGPEPTAYDSVTDSTGNAVLEFPMPPVGPAGAEILVRASSADGQDELRYTLRPKPKA